MNDGLPVWHLSVSVWSDAKRLVSAPVVAEKEAVRCLRGVGGDREWWYWNPDTWIGHLRVAVTDTEADVLPPGIAAHDAGEPGPERDRTRK